jgi:branched-chain amino acid transport system substrate-binding protein
MSRTLRFLAVLPVLAAAASCGEKTVLVGAVLPLTGSAEIYGKPIRNGVELAFAEVTAEDFPYALQLEIVDSASDADKAAEQAEALYQKGALAVIGGVTSAEALEMVGAADRADRILLSPSASQPQLTGISKNFYRVFPSDFLEGTKMGNFATATLELETAVIIAEQQPYARGIQAVFKEAFERQGGKVLEVIEYPPNTSDYSGLLGRVLTLKPQGVYLAAYANEVAAMIRGLRGLGYQGSLLTTSSFASPQAIQQAGTSANGVFLTQAVFEADSETPEIRRFVAAYRAKYGSAPDLYAAHGFDAMKVLAQALRATERPTSNELWKGMRSIREYPGVTGSLQFDEKGDVQKYPRIYSIRDGLPVDYEGQFEERRRDLEERRRDLERRMRELERQGARPPGG